MQGGSVMALPLKGHHHGAIDLRCTSAESGNDVIMSMSISAPVRSNQPGEDTKMESTLHHVTSPKTLKKVKKDAAGFSSPFSGWIVLTCAKTD